VQVAGLVGGLPELAPQPRQVDVDGLVATAVGLVPDRREEVSPGHDLPGMAGEVLEEVELLAREVDAFAVQRGHPAGAVDDEATDGNRGCLGTALDPAEDGSEPRREVFGGEGLHHVVVGTRVEHGDDVRLVVARRGDDDRQVVPGPDHPEQVGPVDVGEPQVEDQRVRWVRQEILEAGESRGGGPDRESVVAEAGRDELADPLVVFDQEHGRHRRSVPVTCGLVPCLREALTVPWWSLGPAPPYDGDMRRWVIVALWLAGTIAASSMAFVAVAMVGDVAVQPAAILAPVDAADGLPGEVVLAQGTVAVDCLDSDSASLSWAQPAGEAVLVIGATGPPTVSVEFISDDEVTSAVIGCADGVPVPTVTRRSVEDVDEDPPATSAPTTSTTEPEGDDEVSSTTAPRPTPTTSTSTTATTEPDDDDDDGTTTSTTEPDDDDDDTTTSTTSPDDDD
jgi:hypothetical protein